MSLSSKEKTRLKSQYGPWALVTGASSGIGREIALLLADAGLNVIINARRKAILKELAQELKQRNNIEVAILEADLSTADGRNQLLALPKQFEVGLLVASAGYGTSGNFIGSNIEEELNMLEVNCTALFQCTHHFAQQFAKRKKGGIILMSSIVGFQGVPYAAHYAATKAYVQSLGEALSVELKPLGIDVLAAAPGPVSSGFAQRANMQMDMTLKVTDVAVPILKALGRKSTVLPGWLSKVLVGALRTVPRWGKVRVMKLVMGGMTAHQRGV